MCCVSLITSIFDLIEMGGKQKKRAGRMVDTKLPALLCAEISRIYFDSISDACISSIRMIYSFLGNWEFTKGDYEYGAMAEDLSGRHSVGEYIVTY